jgi:hypothetical protein
MPTKTGGSHGEPQRDTYGDMQDSATRLTAGEQDIESKLRELKTLVDSLVLGAT